MGSVVGAAEQVPSESLEIQVDESRWPVLIVTPPRVVDDQRMREYLDRHRKMELERQEHYVQVLDLRRTGKLTPEQRQMLTDRMKFQESGTMCVGLAMIFESRVLRGVLSMIFWVRRPVFPTRIFATPQEAIPWAREQMRAFERQRPRRFFAQCDAFRSAEKANEVLAAVRELGLDAKLVTRSMAELEMLVPRVGPFDSSEQALTAIDRLEGAGISARLVDE